VEEVEAASSYVDVVWICSKGAEVEEYTRKSRTGYSKEEEAAVAAYTWSSHMECLTVEEEAAVAAYTCSSHMECSTVEEEGEEYT
jgi:hypothetical protein